MDMTHTVRPDWMFELAAAAQRLVGGLLAPWPGSLSKTIAGFVGEVPEAQGPAEQALLRSRLPFFASRVEDCHHSLFHRTFHVAPCAAVFVTHRSFEWSDASQGAIDLFKAWSVRYETAFEASHQWPAAIRAAVLIEKRWALPLDIDGLSREIACSRSALTHSAIDVLGVSLRDYLLQVRMRHAFEMLRAGDKVDAVAVLCGYAGAEAFARAFHGVTGLMPSEVRHLANAQAATELEHLPDRAGC
jgi:AraC-like DNA-binding protein